jgi:hypothetical protein
MVPTYGEYTRCIYSLSDMAHPPFCTIIMLTNQSGHWLESARVTRPLLIRR